MFLPKVLGGVKESTHTSLDCRKLKFWNFIRVFEFSDVHSDLRLKR